MIFSHFRPCLGISATVIVFSLAGTLTSTDGAYAQHMTTAGSQMNGLAGWSYKPLFTVGETISGTNYTPIGILDGIGATKLNNGNVRVFVNHEVTSGQGTPYLINPGTANELEIRGARVSFFDIDQSSRKIIDAGLAYDSIYDRSHNLITNPSQFELPTQPLNSPFLGLDRFCSGSLFEANSFGNGMGFADPIYFAGEETGNGTQWAIDVNSQDLWAAPEMGRGAWENWTEINTGRTDRVAMIGGDDTESAPLYLYVGNKGLDENGNSANDFMSRNGLKNGKLYVWKSDTAGAIDPQTFNGTGSSSSGQWVEVTNRGAGTGFLNGYATDTTLRAEADAKGAFSFSRPEDLATNPKDGTEIVFASTGRGSLYPADNWGTVYTLKNNLVFDGNGELDTNASSANIEVLYDGDDAGNGQFSGPDYGLRSPDNVDWGDDGKIYVNEDRSTSPGSLFGGTSGKEASVWQIDPKTGKLTRIAEMNRSAALPDTQTDSRPTDIGNWESSGVLDVTNLFNTKPGERLLILDVQAHSITDGSIGGSTNLVRGGQLALLSNQVPESSSLLGLLGFGISGVILSRYRRQA